MGPKEMRRKLEAGPVQAIVEVPTEVGYWWTKGIPRGPKINGCSFRCSGQCGLIQIDETFAGGIWMGPVVVTSGMTQGLSSDRGSNHCRQSRPNDWPYRTRRKLEAGPVQVPTDTKTAYRPLVVGDVIASGDEFLHLGRWRPCVRFVGAMYREGGPYKYRRKIEHQTSESK